MDPNNPHSLSHYHPQPPPPHHLPPPHHHYPQLQPPITYPPPPGTDHHHHPYDPSFLYHHSDKQNISTLFISGLPDDVKPREIHNLFRRRRAFDFCQIKYTGRGNQVVAFASFLNHQAAMEVLHTLNGATFDPQTGATLHIELARSNSRPKRIRGAGAYYVIDKRAKVSDDANENSSNDGDDGFDEPLHTDNPIQSNKGGFATAQSVDHSNAGVKDSEQAGDRPPCSTLFIANLGPTCTDEELKGALSIYPGFHIVKMRANRGMPVAFADFEEVDQATEAMQGLQGIELPSSDRGGMHIEYARSKMRKT